MGARQLAARNVDEALAELFDDDGERTANERSFINDLSCLKGNLTAPQLEVLLRTIRSLKGIIEERDSSN